MRRMRDHLQVMLLVAALAAFAVGAQEEREPAQEESQPEVQSAPPGLAVYVPPSRGAARVRAGGGTRGVDSAGAPRLEVLAPDHVGLTLREQPTLAWFVSGASDARIDFTLIDEGAIDPVTEVTLEGPFAPGVHLVRLADLGIELEPETVYEWSVSVVTDPQQRDRDLYSGGAVKLTRLPDPVPASGGDTAVDELARRGVWYDAIAELSEAIERSPQDPALRARRAALLSQVGLDQAASYDREPGSGGGDERTQP